jgi:hypothetical protein
MAKKGIGSLIFTLIFAAIGTFFLIVYLRVVNGTLTAEDIGALLGGAIAAAIAGALSLFIAIGAGVITLILLIVTIVLMSKNKK